MFFLWPIKLAVRLLVLVVTAIVVYLVVCGVQVVLASRVPTGTTGLVPADAIVVMPAGLDQGAPGPSLLSRLQEALACYRARLAPKVVVAGPAPTGANASASEIARAWLATNGVPDGAIAEEPTAAGASVLNDLSSVLPGTSRLIVVTDALNAYVDRSIGTKAGYAVEIAAPPSERPFYQELGPVWNQASAVAVGRIIGLGRTSWASS